MICVQSVESREMCIDFVWQNSIIIYRTMERTPMNESLVRVPQRQLLHIFTYFNSLFIFHFCCDVFAKRQMRFHLCMQQSSNVTANNKCLQRRNGLKTLAQNRININREAIRFQWVVCVCVCIDLMFQVSSVNVKWKAVYLLCMLHDSDLVWNETNRSEWLGLGTSVCTAIFTKIVYFQIQVECNLN